MVLRRKFIFVDIYFKTKISQINGVFYLRNLKKNSNSTYRKQNETKEKKVHRGKKKPQQRKKATKAGIGSLQISIKLSNVNKDDSNY